MKVPLSLVIIVGFMYYLTMLISSPECAVAADKDIINQISNQFYQQSSLWTSTLQQYALRLFYLLMILEVVIFGIKGTLQRTELPDVMGQFFMTIMFGAFIYVVILNYSDWAWQIINGFIAISNDLGFGVSPSDSPFKAGLELVKAIWKKTSIFSPGESLGYLICGLIVLICFALITAQVLFVKCEAYIALNAAVILLGFGSCTYFKEYAINTMRYVLSVAFKLFVMQLVLGLGVSIILGLESSTGADDTSIAITIGVSIVLLALVKSLPDVAAGIINGSHVSSGAALTSAAAGVAGAVTAGAVATMAAPGRGMAALQNIRDSAGLAEEQGKSGLGKAAGTLGNLWSAHQDTRHDRSAGMQRNLQGRINETRSANEAARQESSLGSGNDRNTFGDGGGV